MCWAARAGQRIFAAAVVTCGLDSLGQTFKIAARDSDLPDLPE
ncbi:hypothetical protein RUR49_11355 [Pseudoxanthobacter sp. M-2]